MTLQFSNRAQQNTLMSSTPSEDLLKQSELKPIDPQRELERISFSRSRQIMIDWDQVVASASHSTPYLVGTGIEYLRAELERLWGYPDGLKTDADVQRIGIFTLSVDPPLVIFGVPKSQRRYTVVLAPNNTVQLPPLPPAVTTMAQYTEFWANVARVSSRDDLYTEMSSVDLAPAIIYRQYRELVSLRSLGASLSASADKIAARELDAFLSAADIDALTASYLTMKSLETDIGLKLERLRDRARDLGYYLTLEKESIALPDGTKFELNAGEIYQPYLTLFRWQTVQYRRMLVRNDDWFSSSSWVLQIPYEVQHVQQVSQYRKIIPDFDPWVEKERELAVAGFTVFRFVRLGEKYLTQQGEPIEQIVQRCELDVDFGNRCAVMIPVYEQGLVSGEVLARYLVILRPRRGTQPIYLPRLYIEEDLLFSTHFHSVEVGELVESINLAPGEEREISIEKSTLAEQETRRTATSISDLNESDRIDLSTEMEHEASVSNERTTTQSMSAKVGGSYGPVSGSAEGGSSSTETTRQFARDLQKVANKASRAVTRQTRQEVKTESSLKTSATTRQSTKITIRNINDGRTLNLLFFQLYNIYKLSLRLEGMAFTLLSGREIIAGTGIVLPEIYPLHQLPEVLGRMDLAGFPIRPNDALLPGASADALDAAAREAYQKLVVAALTRTLQEYNLGASDSSESVDIDFSGVDPHAPAAQQIVALTRALNAIQYMGSPVTPPGQAAGESQTLVVGSPGLYLDAFVGVRPGTEPYSENMRQLELERVHAEVRDIHARAAYSEALAHRLYRVDPGNVVSGQSQSLRSLVLTFEKPPLLGEWSLYIADAFVTDFPITSGDLVQRIAFANDQTWLDQSAVDIARIVHKELKQELTFLI
ncbi:hypothetical protein [Janthinobacterium psychrotolerans]|uniref:Uncharacterized protein n=1 Tax=Janthinobacterium psychrotolerans TaxID=1747903 RepID=A0A1A7C9T9_9BURK|nr:hypothetical protein [Janthinobacterium psychrotolerans]OBV41078.1 hypothetical protein ASR47_102349 [Janthinobacterium psychrotolerans]